MFSMTSLIKREEERNDSYKTWPYNNLQQNQQRRMKLQIDLQSQQRNHRLSRAGWLQSRWLEISEQERRAQLHNQKLLQDFQRAQDTLDDMVARTEAMNTIRVQYERYLEENFPRWQQKLKDLRVSEQSEQMKAEHRSDITAHPFSSNSAVQSQHPTSQAMLNTHQTQKDIRQNDHLYLPPTWLTGSQPLSSGLPQNNIPKDYKNFHNIQALNHHFTPYCSLPCDSHHQSHSPVQQKSSSIEHIWQNPGAGIRQGLTSTGHFTPNASWPQLPVLNPMAWGMMDVPDPGREKIQCGETDQENTTKETLKPLKESNKRLKHKRKGRDQSSELDCRPDHKDSSEGNGVSSVKVTDSGKKDRRKKIRDRTQSHSKANKRESQGFSTVSQDAPLSASGGKTEPKRSKKHQKPSSAAKQDTRKEVKMTENEADKEDEELEESRSQEIPPSHASSDKPDGTEKLNQNSAEEEDTDEAENVHDLIAEEHSDRKVVDEGEEGTDDAEEAGLDEAQEEKKSEKVVRNRDETEHSDGEDIEREGENPENIPASDIEEEGEKPEGEIEENSSQDELTKEARRTRGRTIESGRKYENKSDEEESNNNVDVNTHINNSFEELYAADKTEEEEVYNQEIEDDDEGDEIVVDQAYPWSKDPSYGQTKCHDDDDDDDDIEDLLNPQVNSHTQQEDDVEETDQPKDLGSDLGEEDLPKKTLPAATDEPVESDDEFDHFYD